MPPNEVCAGSQCHPEERRTNSASRTQEILPGGDDTEEMLVVFLRQERAERPSSQKAFQGQRHEAILGISMAGQCGWNVAMWSQGKS